MVQKAKARTLSFDEVVRAVKAALPKVGGSRIGDDRWEAHTDSQVRIDIFSKRGLPGVSLLWEYHDGKHKHQCGKHSIASDQLAVAVQRIVLADREAVPARFVQEVEEAKAAARDPALLIAALMKPPESEEPDEPEDLAIEEEVVAPDPVLKVRPAVAFPEGEDPYEEEFKDEQPDPDVEAEEDLGDAEDLDGDSIAPQ